MWAPGCPSVLAPASALAATLPCKRSRYGTALPLNPSALPPPPDFNRDPTRRYVLQIESKENLLEETWHPCVLQLACLAAKPDNMVLAHALLTGACLIVSGCTCKLRWLHVLEPAYLQDCMREQESLLQCSAVPLSRPQALGRLLAMVGNSI